MKRLLGWIGGAVGGITAYRLLRRRTSLAPEASSGPATAQPDARAEELRERLAESRATEPATEPVVEEPAAEADEQEEQEPPDERRRRVHEEGRAAIDDMQSE